MKPSANSVDVTKLSGSSASRSKCSERNSVCSKSTRRFDFGSEANDEPTKPTAVRIAGNAP